MFKSRKTVAALLVSGVVMIAGIIAVAGWTQAAPAAATASATPAAQVSNSANAPHIDMAKYADLFVKSFEGQLSIDDAKLNAAFSGAVSDTLDQVVKDGLVTSAQAAQINTFAKDGVTGLVSRLKTFPLRFGARPNWAGKGLPAGNALSPASLAAALGMSSSDLETALKSGKSIADVAKERNVDLQTVKNTVLAKAKTDLDAAVSSGKLTQSQADQMVQGLSQKIDNVMSRTAPLRMPAQSLPFAKGAATIDRAKYANLFLTAFESRLGIDDARLDAALAAAVADTGAQAVKDGAITSDMAAQANSFAKMGVRQLASFANKMPFGPFGGARGPLGGILGPNVIASALGMSGSDLEAQLKAGKTIADIAAAHNLNLAQVKQTLLTQIKTQLDAAVKSGQLQQTMADQMYAKISGGLDTLLNKPMFGAK